MNVKGKGFGIVSKRVQLKCFFELRENLKEERGYSKERSNQYVNRKTHLDEDLMITPSSDLLRSSHSLIEILSCLLNRTRTLLVKSITIKQVMCIKGEKWKVSPFLPSFFPFFFPSFLQDTEISTEKVWNDLLWEKERVERNRVENCMAFGAYFCRLKKCNLEWIFPVLWEKNGETKKWMRGCNNLLLEGTFRFHWFLSQKDKISQVDTWEKVKLWVRKGWIIFASN